MGDPTGLSGIVVAKLVDLVIQETKTTKQCQENCGALNKCLQTIRPLVYSVARDLSADEDGTVVAGLGPVKKWLEDLQTLLLEAGALVLKCQKTVKGWNLMRRNEFSKQILNVQQKIEDICTAEANLAILKVDVGTARGVDDTLKAIAQLPLDVGNAVEEIFQRNRKEADQIFQEIKDQLAILVARSSEQASSSQQTSHEAEMRPVTGKSFGVNDPFERLRELLLRDDKNSKYVGVCGTGGIGKTRLAELAYNSKKVRDHFQRRIWLTVGKEKSIEALLLKLAAELSIKTEHHEPDEIKTKLFNALRNIKVLLVLDDIWDNGDPVLEMLDVTSGLGTGSKILVTTRHIKVLETKGAQQSTIRMKNLSSDDSWALFRELAFNGVDQISNEVEKLAKGVATECKGLPLALKVVAGALAGKESPQQWRRALKRLEEAKLLDRSHEMQLYNRLRLSYDELAFVEIDHPHRLQKCFIYFASFPEDSDIDAEKLVRLWAGEKLVGTSTDDTGDDDNDLDPLEDGYCLLRELHKRSLIELREEERSRTFVSLHDVLRDFARHLIREKRAPMDCLFSPGKGLQKFPDEWLQTPSPSKLISNATHLSLNNNVLQSLPEELNAPSLEVLLLANNHKLISGASRKRIRDASRKHISDARHLSLNNNVLQSLRGQLNANRDLALSLEDLLLANNHPMMLVVSPGFLESFSNLKVLDLQSTLIASLPETLGNLTNLTYLELSQTGLMRLPRGLCNLTKLEYLGLAACAVEEFPPTKEGAFPKLKVLDMRYCKSLMNFCCNLGLPSSMAFPALEELDMRACVALQEFPRVKDGTFPKLEKLCIDNCIGLKKLGEGFASKGAFPTLKELLMNGCVALEDFPRMQEGAFPMLQCLQMSSCKGLKRFHEGIVSKTDLSTLKELDMSFCEALEEFPPTEAGAFSNLEILWIYACKGLQRLGEGFASKGAFPALKVLNMSHCGALEEFASTEEGAFPKLKQLWMNNCRSLKQLGEGFASKGAFPALEVLSLSDCIELENFPLIDGGILPKLEKLWMHNCKHLLQLGEGFASNGAFPALEELNMSDCVALEKFPPTQGGSFPKLRKLGMRNCKSLKELSQGFASKGTFPALQVLNMSHCCALKEFPPTEEGAFPKLEKLIMSNCKGLKHLGKGFASNGAFPVLKVKLLDCS
ncbi:unnamed protein product [Calypogeia fissa]